MRKLEVYIEEDGDFVLAGQIQGETWEDARFIYEKSYLENQSHQPVSISLPFQEDAFSPFETRCYFEGLLPEGYTRRCVAGWMHVAEEDYLSVLAGLGNECLGSCSPDGEKLSAQRQQALSAACDPAHVLSAELPQDAGLSDRRRPLLLGQILEPRHGLSESGSGHLPQSGKDDPCQQGAQAQRCF